MNDYQDYDSGPFCRHWSDPSDCELNCLTLAIIGVRNISFSEHDSKCDECDCKKYVDGNEFK